MFINICCENKLYKRRIVILFYCVLRRYGIKNKVKIYFAYVCSKIYVYLCVYVVVKIMDLDSLVGVISFVYGKFLVS